MKPLHKPTAITTKLTPKLPLRARFRHLTHGAPGLTDRLTKTAWGLTLPPRALLGLLKDTFHAWLDDRAPSMGAALAYYTLFSLTPLLIIAISVAGAAFGVDAARREILLQLDGLLGSEGAAAVASLLQSVRRNDQSFMGTVLGTILLLVGATSVFAELQDALDRIWKLPVQATTATSTATSTVAKPNGWLLFLYSRLVSFGLVLGIGFLLMVSLAVSAALAAWGHWWAPAFGNWDGFLQLANHSFAFGLTATLFALIYKFMPHQRVGWVDVWLGSAVTSLLFTLGKAAIGTYIGSSGIASGFGAASSLVVVLIWVYWSAQVFLFGAEFTWVFAHRYGSRRAHPAG